MTMNSQYLSTLLLPLGAGLLLVLYGKLSAGFKDSPLY